MSSKESYHRPLYKRCAECGEKFIPHNSKALTCGQPCRSKRTARRAGMERALVCVVCQVAFVRRLVPSAKSPKSCSPGCAAKLAAARLREIRRAAG